MKIYIIGAGPAGNFLAYLLAEKYEVQIYENHSEVGLPVQCSGLVTNTIRKINDIFNSKEFEDLIKNQIKEVRLFSKNEDLHLELKNPDVVLDREKFDKWLAQKAIEKGAKLNLNHEFIDFNRKNGKVIVHLKNKEEIKIVEADILIGADGFFSKVSKLLGNERDFVPCIQADIIHSSKQEVMDIYFSEKYKELFAWIVPKNENVSEVGIGCKEDTALRFKEFLNEKGIKGDKLKYTGGPISLYSPNFKNHEDNVYLVGEAASFIKGSTLGGIIPSLLSSKLLAKAIMENKDYDKELKKVKKEMKFHNSLRKVMDKFTEKDYDYLIKLFKSSKVKKLLESHSRDEYSSRGFKLKLFMNQPKLSKFLLKLIK